MKISRLIYFSLIIGTLANSCNSDDIIKEDYAKNLSSNSAEIMSFANKELFQQAIENSNLEKPVGTRAARSFYSANDAYENASEDDLSAEKIGFLVPDEKLRNLLNKDLEVIINDTLYRITKDGTFYARCKNKNELYDAIEKVDKFQIVSDDLKELGNVKLKDTFGTWNNGDSNPISNENYFEENGDQDEDEDEDITASDATTRATNSDKRELTREDVENFRTIGTVNVSIIDKILRLSPHYLKHEKIRFKSNPHRKLYVSLYRYNYVFGISIGLDCKVMKKLWHGLGWGRMKHWDDGIYYGISSLIIRQQISQPIFDDFMKDGKAILKREWESVSNCNFTTYVEATYNFRGGIEQRWITEYNKNQIKSQYIIPIIGESVSTLLGESKPSEKAAKMFDQFLVKKGIHYLSKLSTDKPGQQVNFFSENDRSVYSLFSNDLAWNGGGYHVKETFLKYYRNIVLGFSFNSGDKKLGIKNLKSIKTGDNDFVGAPEIFFCEGLVYTRDGDGWIGVKILQNNTDGLIKNTEGTIRGKGIRERMEGK